MGVVAQSELLSNVSRETGEKLSIYVETLLKWNKKINLIGRATADQVWDRHIADSAQLSTLAPSAQNWIDLGAGAGLPALIIAALRQHTNPRFQMTVIESDQRKCAFMAEVSRNMNTPIQILKTRIEKANVTGFDTVPARAFAPPPKLSP